MDPFIYEAVNAITHLRDGRRVTVKVKYYKNDCYNIGLWCDAPNNDGKRIDTTDANNVGKSIVNNFLDHFILINNSLMTIQGRLN